MGLDGEKGFTLFLEDVFHVLESAEAMKMWGIFRVGGSLAIKKEILQEYDSGLPCDEIRAKVVEKRALVETGAALKQFTRDLSPPLFHEDKFELFNQLEGNPFLILIIQNRCLTIIATELPIEDRASYIRGQVLTTLSVPQTIFFKKLVAVLRKISQNSGLNGMTSTNLSIVWSPNMINPDSTALHAAMCATKDKGLFLHAVPCFLANDTLVTGGTHCSM